MTFAALRIVRRLFPLILLTLLTGSHMMMVPAVGQDQESGEASGDPGTRMLRDPDVSHGKVVFVHANDLWLVPLGGGEAIRLTADEGQESDPSFSPDGQWIAFTGQYGGNTDVYVIPAGGGVPKQLTWHPGSDVVQGWTPDGKVLFRSGRDGQPTRQARFFQVSTEGGLPTPLELPQANQGEMSPDGKYLAYQETRLWDPEWRNYRGGQALPIRIVSTQTWDIQFAPWEGERHLDPVWLGDVVYYISERDYAANVWSYNPRTKEHRQMTHHVDFDVKSLGAGQENVVYEQGGYLHQLDTSSAESSQIVVHIARDLNQSRPRWEDVSSRQLSHAHLSPTGQRALFQARGDLFTVPLEKGSWRNLTRTSGVADRHPVWSPKGDQIAWFNDQSGEYALVLADQFGKVTKTISIPDPTFFFVPTWSPDGKSIAFTDTDYRVLVLDLETEEVKHIDTDRFAHPERSMNPVWSPDSRWLAYARRLDNQLRAIVVHDTETGTNHQLTDGMADAISPVWDASGKYLYFLASTDYGLNTGWLDMTSYDRPVTRSLYVAILAEKTASPFLPKSDEEKTAESDEPKEEDKPTEPDSDAKSDAKDDATDNDDTTDDSGNEASDSQDESQPKSGKEDDDNESKKKSKDQPKVVIDWETLGRRIVDAPGAAGKNYTGLAPAPEGKVFLLESQDRGTTLLRYSLEDKKSETFAENISEVVVSHDRKKVLLGSGSNWQHADTGGSGKSAKTVSVGDIRVKVDPKAEWHQMLREGWRFMRDFLYVENVHGADWDKVWDAYSPWLESVDHRSDFNYLLDMVSGEVAVGHSYVVGGDLPDLDNPRTGLLGIDWEVANDHLRITRIYDGGAWNPGRHGPLAQPGLEVSEGDYVLAINGVPLDPDQNPYQLLEGTAGRTISITVASEPDSEETRRLDIEPLSSEGSLRTWAWVEANQKRVDEMSDGRLAYVWLPNTGRGGYTYFNRMYFAQQDREGAIIDERNNGGGSAADYIIEVLERELTGYFNSRAGDKRPFTQPMAGLFGPKVMIINESSGSGGDLLPYLFRFKELGPLVGTRTWGGLVGTWDTPPLIDGGRFVAPRGGFFDVDGNWAVEGEGVAPDIEVRNDPRPVIDGGDPQLEAAIKEALRRLETESFQRKPEPEPPVRSRRPEREQ